MRQVYMHAVSDFVSTVYHVYHTLGLKIIMKWYSIFYGMSI